MDLEMIFVRDQKLGTWETSAITYAKPSLQGTYFEHVKTNKNKYKLEKQISWRNVLFKFNIPYT